ncbi:hypothetical protein [Klebsiella pasteurii]|uniref:hypothetical protein n=1 Tax=Klebsiella pasteurii TaxID=2587529 RepID=UPI0011597709|nr:hypothetical protein [Klebsiella pasteurii]QUE97093.1 hypothetical protein KCG39_03010 [Klebsiella pasteurii]VUS24498.1 hypothetical protein SB6414_00016 [Klebsiella pasteurii]
MTKKIHNDYFKWWCGTVIVGAIPIFIRLIAFLLTNKNIELFNITELVCFGFSIQISSIYFGMGKPSKLTENRLIINTTLSLVFVMLFSIIYIMSIMSSDTLESSTTKIFLTITCGISLFVGQNSVKCAIINNTMLAEE